MAGSPEYLVITKDDVCLTYDITKILSDRITSYNTFIRLYNWLINDDSFIIDTTEPNDDVIVLYGFRKARDGSSISIGCKDFNHDIINQVYQTFLQLRSDDENI